MMRAQNTRQRIIKEAADIFYQHGYRTSGVEFIAKSVGVTKATLYHHFTNKDELIEEALKYTSTFHLAAYQKSWGRKGLSAIDKLTVLFEDIQLLFKQKDCFGCPFINAASEYTNRHSAVRQICEQHYALLIQELEFFACEANLKEPRIVAEQLASCIMGTYSAWFVGGLNLSALHGQRMAKDIIAAHRAH
ncbi:MAG: TetR/AcrR family transcriptional regulator [Rickettsiales bacterium]|nr:TetR/AcrR family transcriptional regulator [Rickettsiales bacterium]